MNANVSSIKLMNLKKAALCGLFFYFPKNKFIVFFLFLLIKDFLVPFRVKLNKPVAPKKSLFHIL